MPNPGRMKELLTPDAPLLLEKRDEPGRKTKYKVVGVGYAGQWGSLEIATTKEADTAFATNQTWVRIIMQVDVAVRQPLSFCYTTGITT